ncbi:MAG: recombinase family protein [Niastella sp.]|nr:recombinase family protein [Niastella sp.]
MTTKNLIFSAILVTLSCYESVGMFADLYIRVSTEEQRQYGYSQRYQMEVLRFYCNTNLLEIGRVVYEECSARNFNRPEWNKLFFLYKSKKLLTPRILLFTKWDRFSRNTGDAYFMINQLSSLGIKAMAVEQPLDLSIPETKMMMAFYLAVPEVENERRGINIRQGLYRGSREGRYMGKPPIGYKSKVNAAGIKTIEPVQPYAHLIKIAFEELAEGVHNTSEVYRYIVTLGFDKSESCLRDALRNPTYCGKVHVVGMAECQLSYAQGLHQPIITVAIFDKAQQNMDRRRVYPRRTIANSNLPMRGQLICPSCKRILTGSGSKGRHKVYYYYHCLSSCGKRFNVDLVHKDFLRFLQSLTPNRYFADRYIATFNFFTSKSLNEDLVQQTILQNRITEQEAKITKAQSLLLSETIDPVEYKSLKQDCRQKIEVLEELIANSISDINRKNNLIIEKRDFIHHIDQLYQLLPTKEKKEFIALLFPYGLTLTPSCFIVESISPSLQVIYREKSHLGHLTSLHDHPANDSVQIDQLYEPPFIKQLIAEIMTNYTFITSKQAIDIARYFRKIINFSTLQVMEHSLE